MDWKSASSPFENGATGNTPKRLYTINNPVLQLCGLMRQQRDQFRQGLYQGSTEMNQLLININFSGVSTPEGRGIAHI